MQKQIEKQVYKITTYMTPSQWDELSKWSCTIEKPWLALYHETNKHAEYVERKAREEEIYKNCHKEIIYTTSS